MSLLPCVQITEFLDKTLMGATTKPMSVLGADGKEYVLKIFSQNDANQRSYTVAETLAHILAHEFDLSVPKGIFMKVEPSQIDCLRYSQPTLFDKLTEKATDKVLFASEFQRGYTTFSPSFNSKKMNLIEIETILAFDILIGNDDRRSANPNILKGPKGYMLIDHEKCFEGLEYHLQNVKKGVLPHYFKGHLFYNIVRKAVKRKKIKGDFATFSEYLCKLNLSLVEENVQFLISEGYDKVECEKWLSYLKIQRNNFSTFVNLLSHQIRE